MIPEDSDSWLITALSDEIWCFQGWHLCRWGANDLPTARAGAAGAAWKRVIERQRDTDLYISYRILSYHIFSYLIVPCHIFIPLHTQTGVKFEIDNVTDLFWEQRPRLWCAGALFFKFENTYGCESKIGYGSLRGDPYYGSRVLT